MKHCLLKDMKTISYSFLPLWPSINALGLNFEEEGG
jgi:hypothetical protein